MTIKLAVSWWPLCVLALASAAHADSDVGAPGDNGLGPYSAGVSETIGHDDNITRTDNAHRRADWLSTTELHGALNQPLGRDQLVGSAGVNYTAYRNHDDHSLDSFGYRGALRLDWSTIGDLSGSLGADATRRRYQYGFEDTSGAIDQGNNLETDSHAFAKVLLGGPSRWNIFAGFDANRRRFSAESYAFNDEQQWSQSLGTTYSTSPDLSFGVTGSYTRGEYPNYTTSTGNFDSKSISATTKWQASGNSSLNSNLGYTTQDSQNQPALRFVSGGLNWNWTPPSHFTVNLGVSRSTNGSAATGAISSLNDRSLNTIGALNVNYLATAKVNFTASAQYIHRKYSNVTVPVLLPDGTVDTNPNDAQTVSGTNHTARLSLFAHYQPTRTTDLSCGVVHELRSTGSAALTPISRGYTDNSVQCTGSIDID